MRASCHVLFESSHAVNASAAAARTGPPGATNAARGTPRLRRSAGSAAQTAAYVNSLITLLIDTADTNVVNSVKPSMTPAEVKIATCGV